MVGSAGLEPTTPRSSDECSHPVSYEPAEDGGVDPRGLVTATSFQGPVPRRRRIFQFNRGERRARSVALSRPTAFGAVPATPAGSLSMRLQRCGGRRIRIPAPLRRPLAFQTVTAPGGFILPVRRADDSNATGDPAQSLAATPSALTGSLSMVRPEGLEPPRLSAPASETGVSTEFPPQAHDARRCAGQSDRRESNPH